VGLSTKLPDWLAMWRRNCGAGEANTPDFVQF